MMAFRRIQAISAMALLVSIGAAGDAPARPRHDFPLTSYEERSICGFVVLVNRQVLEHADEAQAAFAMLDSQLTTIVSVLPKRPLHRLREVRIWLEWEIKPGGAAEFHPSADWLLENGYNPEKAGNVEISNARNFVNWSRREQPCMVLHELAHAYHFLVLGADDPAIRLAYENAIKGGLYQEVDHVDGRRREAYARTDRMEYFAEISEAYFGKNDFYPFVREELRNYDPRGYRAVRDAWTSEAPGR